MNKDSLDTLINLLMLLAMFAGLALWWASKRGGARGKIAERALDAARAHRTDMVAANDSEEELGLRKRILQRLASFGDKLPLFDAKQRAKLKKDMVRGGFRSKRAVSLLLAVKFIVGAMCAVVSVMVGSHLPFFADHPLFRAVLMVMTFIVGMIVPEYVVAFRSSRRRRSMANYLPDALDLLVICTNAGNSLSVSIRRVADEMITICPPLSDEFSLTADELQLSGDNTRALLALAERIDLPSIRALISTLTQSMRYGTPISQALRTLSRTERLAHIVSLEEKAAKLAPKMVVPMMLFILPAVVAIAAGPAVIQLMDFVAHQ